MAQSIESLEQSVQTKITTTVDEYFYFRNLAHDHQMPADLFIKPTIAYK